MTTTNPQEDAIDRARYRRILRFFAGVIAHLVWWDILIGRVVKGSIRRSRPERFRKMSRGFRELAVEMGGVMIKLGQFLSSRVDVLPPEVTEELAGLQDEVPPVPLDDICEVLTSDLGDIDRRFAHFESEPLAAASLGQAHRAWLPPQDDEPGSRGEAVVVKVQRPHIEAIVRTDLAALRVVARWTMRYKPIRRRADVPALMEEFAATLWEELDYESEADNAERFAQIFDDDPGVAIPAVFREHSTRHVLVLEYIDGIKITDLEAIAAAGIEQDQVAGRLMDAYFRQIFEEGFFHADPHPGNLFVVPLPWPEGEGTAAEDGGEVVDEGERPFRLAFVDFGMVGHVETLMGENLRRMLVSITQRDARGLTLAYNDLGFFLPGTDLDRITEAQTRLLDQLWGRNLLELSRPDPKEVQELGQEFRDILFDFPFQVPQDFIYLGRTVGMLSGLASILDPDINPWHLIERYGQTIIRKRAGQRRDWESVLSWLRPLITLPVQAQRVLSAAEEGRLRVTSVPDRQTLQRLDRLEKRVGRLSWSLLSAALILAGALFYVNEATGAAAAAWSLAGLFFLVTLLLRD